MAPAGTPSSNPFGATWQDPPSPETENEDSFDTHAPLPGRQSRQASVFAPSGTPRRASRWSSVADTLSDEPGVTAPTSYSVTRPAPTTHTPRRASRWSSVAETLADEPGTVSPTLESSGATTLAGSGRDSPESASSSSSCSKVPQLKKPLKDGDLAFVDDRLAKVIDEDEIFDYPSKPSKLAYVEEKSIPEVDPKALPTINFDSAQVFDTPVRKPLKINPFLATLNITLAFGTLGALITGYAIGLRVFNLGIASVGMYGVILISVHLIQVAGAVSNRWDINRICEKRKKETMACRESWDAESGERTTTSSNLMNPTAQVSIAVVGYREDDKAWRECLRSIQKQTLVPKCIVGVVDGNEAPDLDMANSFVEEFASYNAPLIHLPILLSELHRETYFATVPTDTRSKFKKFRDWACGRKRAGHIEGMAAARQAVINQVVAWDNEYHVSSMDAVIFSQPHGHKRTAMFTAFAFSLWAHRTRDAIFTTDSDTLVKEDALDEMLTLLRSANNIGGVTADVKIWNRSEGLLARLCSARYWFAFNIERACQSMFRCVSCLSGPMSMYRTSDLETILAPWNLQTFGGKQTTFGDDRHLTNQVLAHGLHTRYTHRTWCDSESPTNFGRWVTQQTRWSKSFFREAFWFPTSFLYQSPWMLMEMTIQALYPFILTATVLVLFFHTTDNKWRPLIWIVTLFAISLFKCMVALIISWDPWLLLFSIYGFIYFFGLMPSKLWALLTMNQTGWGTSARSSAERKITQTFWQRSFQVGHLVIWYSLVFTGVGFFVYQLFDNAIFFLIVVAAVLGSTYLYWDYIKEHVQYYSSKWWSKIRGRSSAPHEKQPILEADESAMPEKPPTVSRSSSEKVIEVQRRDSEKLIDLHRRDSN